MIHQPVLSFKQPGRVVYPFHHRKATAAPTTGTTLTTSPKPANSGGILAFPKTPAASKIAARLYTKLQVKLKTTLRWNAFDRSMRVNMPFKDDRMRTASAADWATSVPPSDMWRPMLACARDGASLVPSPMNRIVLRLVRVYHRSRIWLISNGFNGSLIIATYD
jgi:hypothetical protein